MNHKKDGISNYIHGKFRNCKMSDFTSRGYYEMDSNTLSTYLCPDYESI